MQVSDQADHVLAGVLGACALRLQVSGKFLGRHGVLQVEYNDIGLHRHDAHDDGKHA